MTLSVDAADRIDHFFKELVTDGKLAGWSWALLADRRVVHSAHGGMRDLDLELGVDAGTLYRIYSMTKPVTAAAMLLLRERGLIGLDDPLHVYLPEFAATEVYAGGEGPGMRTRPARTAITIAQAASHTAGLTYGFHRAHPVDALYRAAGHDVEAPLGTSLAEACRFWASCPLLFDPGTSWNYSVGLDVAGRVVEVVSGRGLGDFLRDEFFAPLGMADTGFYLGCDRLGDLATLYDVTVDGLRPNRTLGRNVFEAAAGHFGGGGLVSTLDDYTRFMVMLLRHGEGPAGRVLRPETVDLLMRNHMPGDTDIATFGRPMSSELSFDGVGQALGGTVQLRTARAPVPRSLGDYGWGGIAGTYFWVNPKAGTGAVFMLQAVPAAAHPIRARLHNLVHSVLRRL